MLIQLRDPALVVLIGPSGCGKSTFAKRNFRPTEILSSDFCRALVCDDESNQAATDDAFELLHLILAKRLRRRRTTVIDATNVQLSSRRPLNAIALENQIPSVAILFALSEEACLLRNRTRPERQVLDDVIRQQHLLLAESSLHLASEGFSQLVTFRTADELNTATILRAAYS